jgi:acetoacetyl-CoA synthetase
LRTAGVVKGDRVAAFLPNCPEAIIAMLGATSIGAIWSSCSPDFGINGVVDRFGQIEPKILFCADGYFYNGKRFDSLQAVRGVLDKISSIEKTIVVPFTGDEVSLDDMQNTVIWQDFVEDGADLDCVPMEFDHPLYIMYSSGTTGVPKCIVHGVGGTLLQHLKEDMLHCDIGPEDRLFFFTTCGWMMWNWLVSGLATGTTLVLFDGSPFYDDGRVLWKIAEEEKLTVFGTGAKYISSLEKAGVRPIDEFDLGSLKTVLTTGSPLAPESFDFIYDAIATDIQLASISGGTDIIACFAGGNPLFPVRRGELQCLALGMAVEIFTDEGESVIGQNGELVCTRAFPSMPVCFWQDEGDVRYHAAYFEKFPGIWAHGDYAEITESGGMIIHGRSDAVLNPGGVRIGTAEIYRQVEKLDEVLDSIAIGQNWEDDVRVVLFVVMRPGVILDETIKTRIRKMIRDNTTPRHVPAKIISVAEIPRTISGKIVELAVRSVVHGEAVKNTDALAKGTVKPEWIDVNGHMNVAWYVLIFDLAVDDLWAEFGITDEYIKETNGSTFAVDCHITYQNELLENDPYIVTSQILAYDEKRIHHFQRLYHAETQVLAATAEWMNLYIDLKTRKVSLWPEMILANLAQITNRQTEFTMPVEVGKTMGVKKPLYSMYGQQ